MRPRIRQHGLLWAAPVIVLLAGTVAAAHAQAPAKSFASALIKVERLPQIRPVVKTGAFSSYDRTGGNDDGFSGKYSFLRKEGDGLVIAEVTGPGAITRIWTPTPIDAPIEFYFDGETTPRLVLPFKDVFSGKTQPFVGDLTGHCLGGYYSYVPLEFAKSIKVVVRAALFQFYMINYVVYEPQVPVRTFQPGDSFEFPSIKADGVKVERQLVLPAGKSVTVFESKKPGRIESLRLGPAEAFAGAERDIVLRIYWDGAKRPAVDVPVGDFFGYSFGQPAIRSLLLGTEDGWNYARFPMPFAKAARIELVSERSGGAPLHLQSETVVSNRGNAADEGTFHAEWRRENSTVTGQPFTYLDVNGRGQMVAAILQAQGREPGQTYFFEGDEQATIDGEVAINGTGSEDSFNGGWYDIPGRWDGRGSLPFSGCLEYSKHISRTGGYRLFLGDAYSFRHSLRYTIEHGGEGNKVVTDYVGTTFYYLDRPDGDSGPLPNVAARDVLEPESFELTFYPSPPKIVALLGASLQLSAAQLDGKQVNFAALTRNISEFAPPPPGTNKPGEFGTPPNDNTFDSLFGPPVMVVSVDVPKAGTYAISVEGLTGPTGAILRLRVNDEAVGNAVDFYATSRGRSGPQKLAEVPLTEGTNLLYLTLVGKNSQSGGASVDLVSIRGTRLP